MTSHDPDGTTSRDRSGIELRDSAELIAPRGHYSHVAVHAGVAYISGQLPVDATGTPLSDQPFDVQVRQVLTNLEHCLHSAGSSRQGLLSVQVLVTDMAHWPSFDDAYAAWIGAHRPARAVAGVLELHYGAALELHATAVAG